jgi:FkbM family methyltransferase
LKHKGYIPDTILDIGAHHGMWTRECFSYFPQAKYHLCEAIPYNELNCYNGTNIKVYNILLNNKEEMVDWYEKRNTGDSMFKEKSSAFSDCIVTQKPSTTLDIIFTNNNELEISKNIFIKIDCQGAEIPILQGATSVLNKTDFIILEIPLFGQYNETVPNFLQHIQYMDSIGFIPYDIADNHYINGFNMQIDMLFINKTHPFNSVVQQLLL